MGALCGIILMVFSSIAMAQTSTPAFAGQHQGVWVAKNFQFHTGEVMPELKLGYVTLGNPANEAVVILHGTAGSGQSMLNPAFGGELFGPGQPLDASKYYINYIIVKNFYEPQLLVERFVEHGISLTVRETSTYFQVGVGTRNSLSIATSGEHRESLTS